MNKYFSNKIILQISFDNTSYFDFNIQLLEISP